MFDKKKIIQAWRDGHITTGELAEILFDGIRNEPEFIDRVDKPVYPGSHYRGQIGRCRLASVNNDVVQVVFDAHSQIKGNGKYSYMSLVAFKHSFMPEKIVKVTGRIENKHVVFTGIAKVA